MTSEHIRLSDMPVTLFKRPESRSWQARFSLPNEGQIKKSLDTLDKADAIARAREFYLESLVRNKQGISRRKTKFQDVARLYLKKKQLEVQSGEISEQNFKDNILGKIERFFIVYFWDKPIENISDLDIEKFIEWRIAYWVTGPGSKETRERYQNLGAPSPITINRELVQLRGIFKLAEREGHIQQGSAPRCIAPKVKKKRKVATFEPHEVTFLITSIGEWAMEQDINEEERLNRFILLAYVELAASTGMRPGELGNLKWGDIKVHRNGGTGDYTTLPAVEIMQSIQGAAQVSFELEITGKPGQTEPITEFDIRLDVYGKTGEREVMPARFASESLNRLLLIWGACLNKMPEAGRRVFAAPSRNSTTHLQKKFIRFIDRIGLRTDSQGRKRSMYSLRHFYITQVYSQNKVTGLDLAENTGTSPRMIEKYYAHVKLERLREEFAKIF